MLDIMDKYQLNAQYFHYHSAPWGIYSNVFGFPRESHLNQPLADLFASRGYRNNSGGSSVSGRFSVDGWGVDYWRNHPIDTPSTSHDRAVIVIHGTNHNADDYYNYIVKAAASEDILGQTLILAPRFQTAADAPEADALYWSNAGWKKGYKSENGGGISSFRVIDELLGRTSDNFPNIARITIVGHSAGGAVRATLCRPQRGRTAVALGHRGPLCGGQPWIIPLPDRQPPLQHRRL